MSVQHVPDILTHVSSADACSAAEGPWPPEALPAGTRNLVRLIDVLTADVQARQLGFRDHADRLRWLAQRQWGKAA